MIYLNGKERQNFRTLSELIRSEGYRPDRIAVEINGAIIKKDCYETTLIKDGDRIEVVSFVGGG